MIIRNLCLIAHFISLLLGPTESSGAFLEILSGLRMLLTLQQVRVYCVAIEAMNKVEKKLIPANDFIMLTQIGVFSISRSQ